MKSYIYNLVWAWCLLTLAIACSDDDHTGDSTLVASAPSLDVALEFNDNQTLVETEATYGFTVSISEPQIVDVVVNLAQTEGTATDGEDFSFPHQVRIPAGATSASDEIAIHSDELTEETETAVIKIATGTESNVQAINSKTVTFNIQNLTAGDLAIGLSWATSGTVTDHEGNEIAPTDLADLRLLLTDVPYTSIIDDADGAAFETYVLTEDTPDGEYYIVADFFDADENIPADLDLSVSFDQTGTINGLSYEFPAVLNTGSSCSSIYYILAKVVKSGGSYEISSVGEANPGIAESFAGDYTVVTDEWEDYAPGDIIPVELGADTMTFNILAVNNPYITNAGTAYIAVIVNTCTGEVTASSNEDFDYSGTPVAITGSGTADSDTGAIDLVLTYGDFGDYALNLTKN